jgi:hypothetical protein
MINEDILTALRNAIERGESLQGAMNILINSGYNAKEVQEASKFVGSGAINFQEIKPDEHLALISKKSFFSGKPAVPERENQLNKAEKSPSEDMDKIKQEISPNYATQNYLPPSYSSSAYDSFISHSSDEPLASQINRISPPSKYLKEIILAIILIFLLAILSATILFKEKIIDFLSGFL